MLWKYEFQHNSNMFLTTNTMAEANAFVVQIWECISMFWSYFKLFYSSIAHAVGNFLVLPCCAAFHLAGLITKTTFSLISVCVPNIYKWDRSHLYTAGNRPLLIILHLKAFESFASKWISLKYPWTPHWSSQILN